MSEETINSLSDIDSSPIPEEEKAALRFAQRMTLHPRDLGKEDIEALKIYFSDDQIVEICCVAGLFNYLNRFAEAVGLWPTRPGEGGPEEAG